MPNEVMDSLELISKRMQPCHGESVHGATLEEAVAHDSNYNGCANSSSVSMTLDHPRLNVSLNGCEQEDTKLGTTQPVDNGPAENGMGITELELVEVDIHHPT